MISVVVPIYNEEESLGQLCEEILAVARNSDLDLEVVLIDDGSRDASWLKIQSLTARDGRVRGIRFRRNFGKAAALSAGFGHSRGELVITLDGDLQDDPAEIPSLLSEMSKGFDVVSGWKRSRHDPWHKTLPSWVFNHLVSGMTGVHLHDHNSGVKCYRREVFREIRLYGELHRFIPVLAAARGFRVGEIEVRHRPRLHGHSKYGVRRFVKGFLDLLTVKFLTGFGQRPQHLLGSIGLASFAAGCIGLLYLTYTWVVRLWNESAYLPLHERPLLIYSVAGLLLGGQMISIGFLAELITAYQSREEKGYSIAELTPERRIAESKPAQAP
jgi:glycosyltransferase involved in cell wall biosynthesis